MEKFPPSIHFIRWLCKANWSNLIWNGFNPNARAFALPIAYSSQYAPPLCLLLQPNEEWSTIQRNLQWFLQCLSIELNMESYTITWSLLARAFDATIQWLSRTNIICMYTISLWYLGCSFFNNKVDWNPRNYSYNISWAALMITSLSIEPYKMVSLWVKCVTFPLCNKIPILCGINSSVSVI